MIRNLQIVVAETADGDLSILHLSKNRALALDALRASMAGPYRCVLHIRNGNLAARKFPLKRAAVTLADLDEARVASALAGRAGSPDLPLGTRGESGRPARPDTRRDARKESA